MHTPFVQRKRIVLLAAAAGLVVWPSLMPAQAQDKAKPKIVVFTKNVTNPWQKAVRVGAERAGAEYGVEIVHAVPTKPDNIEEQTRLVEDWIVRKPSAFVFVPVDPNALIPSVQKAGKAGIPISLFNNDMPSIDSVTYVGSDNVTIGYQIAKFMFDAIGKKGKVIHIDGVPAVQSAIDRKAGLQLALKEYPNIELLASQPGMFRRLPAVQVFENLMQRFPVIDGVMAANDDMAVGVAEALAAAGRGGKTIVVGVDAIPDGAATILSGKMLASADFSGFDQGYLATVAAIKNLRGEKVPKKITLPVVMVTKANAQMWVNPIEERVSPKWDAVVAAQKL